MGFPQSPVKPEEHKLHDVDSSDLTVVGAQMLSILQPPRPNLPDPEYPLQPVAINDMSSSQVDFPSARDSSVYPNKPLTMYNYHQLQQIPSIYNTSHSSASHQVYLPPKILINDRNPPISHPFDEYDFVSGQYVKRYRSGTAPDSGYYGRTAGNSPAGNAWGCREQNQRYPRNPEDTFHHYRHSWDYLPWGTYKLERVHDEYPTERNNPSERNQNPIANS
uniref:Uncharacterized protein n=2 Tax=Lygus hesperus TaxID=30085 RepID=A0A0K8SQX4_LYGHE